MSLTENEEEFVCGQEKVEAILAETQNADLPVSCGTEISISDEHAISLRDDKSKAHEFLKTLRKQTRGKPKLVAVPGEKAVTALGNLLSALDNPNLSREQKEILDNTLKDFLSEIQNAREGGSLVISFLYDIFTATETIFETITKYSDFSLEELDREIDSEQTENSACSDEIESEVEDNQEQEFMNEEQNEADTWALPISLDAIEDKFYESTVQAPGLAEKTFFCPNNAEVTMKAHNSYAKYGQDETPIIVYDDTVFGECNRGFLLTDKNIYTHNLFSEARKIPLKKTKSVSLAGKMFGAADLVVNGIKIELTQINSAAKQALCELLEHIVFGKETGEKTGEKDDRL